MKMMGVNRLLLPVKLHFLLYMGSLAGSIPFLITYAQQLGASPSTLGVLYATLPFVVMLAKPLLSGIADKFRQHKTVFLGCVALMISGFFSVYFIPPHNYVAMIADDLTAAASTLQCRNESAFYLRTKWHDSVSSAKSEPTAFDHSCDIACLHAEFAAANCSDQGAEEFCVVDPTLEWHFEGSFSVSDDGWSEIPASNFVDKSATCRNFPELVCTIGCNVTNLESESESHSNSTSNSAADNSKVRRVPTNNGKRIFGVNSHIFMLWFCMCVAYVGMGVSLSLADALVLDLLGENKSDYGVQRLWGSIGWGAFSIVAGRLIDQASGDNDELDFSPGFYLTLVLGLLDIVVASRIKVIKTSRPKHIARDVGRLMLNPRIFLFTLAVFVVGMVTGVIWTFLIAHLNKLGATQLLIGLVMATQCFLGELPFFFVSGYFLKKLGHVYAIILALFVFGVRFLLYSTIVNPWTVLPIETLNGFTYGIFFSALATYSSHIAPPGMSATVQGFLQGIYEGFGVGVGCLIGGILFEAWGGASMFFICGIFAITSSIIFYLAYQCVIRYAPLPTVIPISIEIPEIRRDNLKETGPMLNSDGVAA